MDLSPVCFFTTEDTVDTEEARASPHAWPHDVDFFTTEDTEETRVARDSGVHYVERRLQCAGPASLRFRKLALLCVHRVLRGSGFGGSGLSGHGTDLVNRTGLPPPDGSRIAARAVVADRGCDHGWARHARAA